MPARRWLAGIVPLALGLFAAAAQGEGVQRYSYYSPGTGTVNLDNRALEPRLFIARGRPLPDDFIVLTSLSHRLMRVGRTGKVRWILDVARGGGAHGLSSYRGSLVVSYDKEVLFVDPKNGEVTDRIRMVEDGFEPINFVRVQGDYLIVGESSQQSRMLIAKLSEGERGEPVVNVIERIPTRTQWPRDALLWDDGTLVIADTFGHAVVFLERSDRWREVRRMAEYFPNMLAQRGDAMLVLSEHGNRLSQWDLRSGQRIALIACPEPLFADADTTPAQIVAEEPGTAFDGTPPRQRCATDIAGNQTLYAANGFFMEGARQIWVADADNHRVALFVDGAFWGAIENINHPVRVIPVSQFGPRASNRRVGVRPTARSR